MGMGLRMGNVGMTEWEWGLEWNVGMTEWEWGLEWNVGMTEWG